MWLSGWHFSVVLQGQRDTGSVLICTFFGIVNTNDHRCRLDRSGLNDIRGAMDFIEFTHCLVTNALKGLGHVISSIHPICTIDIGCGHTRCLISCFLSK